MITDPASANYHLSAISRDFVAAANLAGIQIELSEIEIVDLNAPHRRPSCLPPGKFAVYTFLHDRRCLKVGKAGAGSAPRYCSQHYGLNARSTLAKSIIKYQARLGLHGLDAANIGTWIRQNTRRISFLIPATYPNALLSLLESFIQCRLEPVFEGRDPSERDL